MYILLMLLVSSSYWTREIQPQIFFRPLAMMRNLSNTIWVLVRDLQIDTDFTSQPKLEKCSAIISLFLFTNQAIGFRPSI